MRSSSLLGLAVGLFTVAVSVGGNLRRGDPHLVSFAPDLLSLAVVWLAMFVAMRRLAVIPASHARDAAFRVSAVAATVSALGLSAFTVWYLPSHAVSLGVASGLGAAVLVTLIGWSAARLALRAMPAPQPPSA